MAKGCARRLAVIFVLQMALFAAGCQRHSGPEVDQLREIPTEDPLARSDFPIEEQARFRFANNLSIEYGNGEKRIRIEKPWRGANFGLSYRLVTSREAAAETTQDDATFVVPARRLVTTSSTQLPHVEVLGLVDRLAGHDRFDYVTSASIRARIDKGLMTEVGDGVRLNSEILVDLQPDLVFVFSIGSPELDILGLLESAGVPFAVDAAWVETTPLARAEWIKFTAAFFNKEAAANRIFDEIADRYGELERLARTVDHRPTVMAGAPFRISGQPWRIDRPAPLLGQHNEAVYCGLLGLPKAELPDLRRAGVI